MRTYDLCAGNEDINIINGRDSTMSSSSNNNNDRQSAQELLVRELLDFCQSKLLTEDGIHKIMKQHKTEPPLKDYDFFFEACGNERVTEGIIRCLLEYFPGAVNANDHGRTALHAACDNKNVTLNIIQFLIEGAPDSVRSVNEDGLMPLHYLCMNEAGDEAAAIQILKFLIEKCPEAVRHADNDGILPIHYACYYSKPPEFCRVLIGAALDSVRITDRKGSTPLHCLCDCIDVEKEVPMPILHLLIENYSEAVWCTDNEGDLPIHLACLSKSPEFCQVLIDAAPESVRSVNNDGDMPFHILCNNKEVNDEIVIQNLKLLIQRNPEAVRHADNDGDLPIHMAAACGRSPEFCRVLIEAYPGSERMNNTYGALPLHLACLENTAPTVEYLYKRFSDGIKHASTQGHYPIHDAIRGTIERDNPADVVDIVKFLLGCDPGVKLQICQEMSVLEFACDLEFNDSNIGAGIQIIKTIYDAHPDAIIEDDRIVSYIHGYHQQVQAFIYEHLVYARQAKDLRLMVTPDTNGQLPLHTALQNNVRLGSIKLLVKGNPSAIRNFDNNGLTPLHVACEHHSSPSVVQYLLGLDKNTLRAVDFHNNTALHYACRGAKYDTIALWLETNAVSVSKQNADGKLPIELLWESKAVEDRESDEYTESVFRLLKAYPETVMNVGLQLQSTLAASHSQIGIGKKRKFGDD